MKNANLLCINFVKFDNTHLYTCTCTFTTLTIVCTDLVMIEQATCDCILIGTLTCNKS